MNVWGLTNEGRQLHPCTCPSRHTWEARPELLLHVAGFAHPATWLEAGLLLRGSGLGKDLCSGAPTPLGGASQVPQEVPTGQLQLGLL